MKENLFPNNVIQSLGLLLASISLATAIFLFIDIHSFFLASELNKTIFYCFWCSLFIGISYLVNFKKKQKVEWNFYIANFQYGFLMMFVLFIFNIGINSPLNNFLSTKTELHNPLTTPFLIVGAVFLGPILEELIFRGIILKGLLTKYSPSYSIIVSAILFGLIHGNPIQIWGAMLTGLFLGWVYFKTKSLGITILLHAFVNLTSLTHDYILFNFIDSATAKSIDKYILFISIPLLFLATRQLFLKMRYLN